MIEVPRIDSRGIDGPLVLASHNAGKLRELRELLEPLGVQLSSAAELGLEPAAEPHPTFLENALAKARAAARASGRPALADDSGLCCAALGGAPGVRSARFAPDGGGDRANNLELLRRLAEVGDRRAHFVCVLVAVRAPDDPVPLVAEGRWQGQIALAPRGDGGFGYDPLFLLPELGCTVAELDARRKQALGHRGQAMRQLLERLRSEWLA